MAVTEYPSIELQQIDSDQAVREGEPFVTAQSKYYSGFPIELSNVTYANVKCFSQNWINCWNPFLFKDEIGEKIYNGVSVELSTGDQNIQIGCLVMWTEIWKY